MSSTFFTELRDYPWSGLVAGLLPARIAQHLPPRFQAKTAQIIPSASIVGNALTVVIAIMSFLACLTAGAVYMINQSASAWANSTMPVLSETERSARVILTWSMARPSPGSGRYGQALISPGGAPSSRSCRLPACRR